MKNIVQYKLFEYSSESIEEILKYLKDIFQEIIDIKYECVIREAEIPQKNSSNLKLGYFTRSLYKKNNIEIYIWKKFYPAFRLSEIKDCVDSSKSYMRSNGYTFKTAKWKSDKPGYTKEYIILFSK